MATHAVVMLDVSATFLTSLFIVLMSALAVAGQQLCDHCNCQISSLTEPQAIYRLSLVCNTGTITWFGASGAVRLEVMPFLRGNFRACFMAESENINVKISQEHSYISSRQNYRLKQEAARTLTLDHVLTSSARNSEFCVSSTTADPVLLYIEAVRTPETAGVPKILFHYDLEKLDSHSVPDPMNDCRPCSKEELLDSYCSMDFVVIGNLAKVLENPTNERTNITLHVKQLIHQREPHFFQRIKRSDPHLTGHVTVPRKCGLRHSHSDFLLTGRLRLNSLSLRCASYLHEWRKIQHETECTHV
ncbi:hypothetical protein BsWGS_06721 [Bradybaena similaris]